MVCGKCGKEGHTVRKCPAVKDDGNTQPSPLTPIQKTTLITLANIVEDVARELHKGRQECVYQKGIATELSQRNIRYTSEEVIPVCYKGLNVGYERMDLFCYELGVILELKAVTGDIRQEFIWQLVNYMREKHVGLGMVVNFSQGVGKGLQIEYVVQHEGEYWTLNCEKDRITPLGDGMF